MELNHCQVQLYHRLLENKCGQRKNEKDDSSNDVNYQHNTTVISTSQF